LACPLQNRAKKTMPNKSKAQRDEMDKNSADSSLTGYTSKLSGIGNTLIALSGLAYASGFIIINLYLANHYGIYSFEILNARYIYSGAAFLLICLMAFLGAMYITNRAGQNKGKSWFERVVDFIISFGIINFLNAVIIQGAILIADSSGFKTIENALSFFPILPWFTISMLFFSLQIYFLKKEHLDKIPVQLPFPSIVFTNFIILAALYGLSVYAFLPPSLGGGLPTPITLVIDKSKIEIAEQLLPVSEQNLSLAVYLIDQNANSLYVLVDVQNSIEAGSDLQTVQISKSLIAGVIYPRNKIPAFP
jgi:hypothetical protein